MAKTAILAAAVACALSTPPADASPRPAGLPVELVTFTAADLGSGSARTRLARRLEAAAREVCTDRYLDMACYDEALADALRQVNAAADVRGRGQTPPKAFACAPERCRGRH